MSSVCDMVNYRKQDVPHADDRAAAFHGFVGSNAQKIIHNDLIVALDASKEHLETYRGEDLIFQQGVVSGIRRAMESLHRFDSRDVKRDFGFDV